MSEEKDRLGLTRLQQQYIRYELCVAQKVPLCTYDGKDLFVLNKIERCRKIISKIIALYGMRRPFPHTIIIERLLPADSTMSDADIEANNSDPTKPQLIKKGHPHWWEMWPTALVEAQAVSRSNSSTNVA